MTTLEHMESVAAGIAREMGITIEEARIAMKIVMRTHRAEIVSAVRTMMKEGE